MTAKENHPKRAFAPGDKIKAIQRVNGGESKASVARNTGVPESTLRRWCKKENKLHYISSRISFPETDKSNDAKTPEKRVRTESPTVAPRSPAATGLDLSSLPIVSQSFQPATVSIDSPIELTTKRRRRNRQDPDASVSMSAISSLSRLSLLGLSAHTNLGTLSNNIATNLWPAHNGMLNLSETRHSGRSKHTSHPYRYSSSRSNQPSTSQAPPAQTLYEAAMWYWIIAQHAMFDLTYKAKSYPSLQLGTSSEPTSSKPVAPTHMDYTRNPLVQQHYKQLYGPVLWPNNKLRFASQVTKEQSADNILYSHLTKGKTENGRASSSPVQNHTRRSEVSATITSPREPHVVQPAISPEVGIENKEPAAENPIESERSHPRGRNVLGNLLLNHFNDTTTEHANVIGSTNGESQEGYAEALEHGEKLLVWLESSRDPSVAHFNVHQLRGLLHKLRRPAHIDVNKRPRTSPSLQGSV